LTKGKSHSRPGRTALLRQQQKKDLKRAKEQAQKQARAKSYDKRNYDGNDSGDPPRGVSETNNQRR